MGGGGLKSVTYLGEAKYLVLNSANPSVTSKHFSKKNNFSQRGIVMLSKIHIFKRLQERSLLLLLLTNTNRYRVL